MLSLRVHLKRAARNMQEWLKQDLLEGAENREWVAFASAVGEKDTEPDVLANQPWCGSAKTENISPRRKQGQGMSVVPHTAYGSERSNKRGYEGQDVASQMVKVRHLLHTERELKLRGLQREPDRKTFELCEGKSRRWFRARRSDAGGSLPWTEDEKSVL